MSHYKNKYLISIITIILIVGLIFLCTYIIKTNSDFTQMVKYGEFPFELTYKLDGETITINDVYVCEYAGVDWNEGVGAHRNWKGYIKSTGDEDLVLVRDGNFLLCCYVGHAEYYMGDDEDYLAENFYPRLYYIYNLNERLTESGGVTEEIKEKYKIEIISWELSDPIENSFE